MIRSELLKNLYPILEKHFVVCNIGLPSQELHQLGDRENFFYMLGTMGLSSSIGFGLALNQPQTIISIDGDGSVLTNLGTLSTIGNNDADNYILFIVDNGSYGSTGDQPTYAGGRTSLTEVAKACGCENVVECQDTEGPATLQAAIDSKKKTVIVCKCESGNIKLPVIDTDPVVIRHRFMAALDAANS